ncbi:MAG: flagellar biosynthesis protein FlhB [Chloroflexi bacterium]|nr:flagellar biosynthesis protein FlhB [Chloroflexota bacterium]
MPAGEKTEEATPRRKQEARKKGQVAKSVEVNSALVLLGGLLILQFFGPGMYDQLAQMMKDSLQNLAKGDFTVAGIQHSGIVLCLSFAKIMAPVFAVAAMIGVVSNVAQMGFVFSTDLIKPKFSRINPVQGFSRMFSKRSMVELLKGLAKIAIVALVAYMVLQEKAPLMVEFTRMEPSTALRTLGSIGLELSLKCAAAIFVLAIADYVFQRREFVKNLRMTRQEVREEMKQSEGSPELKSRIRHVQRQMANRRMMQSVPTADVVITNPTHLAVALKYDAKTMRSPKVVAKGERLMAERIKQVARDNHVPLVENKPLAQALYKAVEIGTEIPAHLFHAVAEVLAFIYGLRGRVHGS